MKYILILDFILSILTWLEDLLHWLEHDLLASKFFKPYYTLLRDNSAVKLCDMTDTRILLDQYGGLDREYK